jgi:NAD(P)-dependent dehydrogenase (short-subunit alcohol dehydrogenase family)
MNVHPFDLTSQTALVTGASSGLGARFAKALLDAGASVILAARREEPLREVMQSFGSGQERCRIATLDVTNAASVAGLDEVIGEVDILVNNAGAVREAMALDQTETDWDAVIDTNLKGMFLVAQATARHMKDRGGGAIVNVASILGQRQASAVMPYAVSKAGVIQMTKVLALEWARYGIRVNALAPGYVNTTLNADFWSTDAGNAMMRRIPQRRLGELEDLDGPLLLLASRASAYMTGSVLVVDGGHLVSTL